MGVKSDLEGIDPIHGLKPGRTRGLMALMGVMKLGELGPVQRRQVTRSMPLRHTFLVHSLLPDCHELGSFVLKGLTTMILSFTTECEAFKLLHFVLTCSNELSQDH